MPAISRYSAPRKAIPTGNSEYRKLRKGVADLRICAQLCQSANQRYLDSLAAADSSTPLKVFTDRLSQPVITTGRRARALNPLGCDAALLARINQPEYLITGFRNADLRLALFGADPDDPVDRRRRSARISRLLALLRAHGLVKKIPHTQRVSHHRLRTAMPPRHHGRPRSLAPKAHRRLIESCWPAQLPAISAPEN